MLAHIRMTDSHKIGLAGVIPLVLLLGWFSAREPDARSRLPMAQEFASRLCALAVSGDEVATTLTFPRSDGTETPLNLVAWGLPSFRIRTTADGRSQREALSEAEKSEFATCIVENQGRYIWLTREMTDMTRSTSGEFVTYHALNGSGYVRLLNHQGSELADTVQNPLLREQLAPRYMEHLLLGFTTITYIGYEGEEIARELARIHANDTLHISLDGEVRDR